MKPGQPAVPFHSTFDFRFAYIDFGCAVHFSPDATDHLVTAEHIPPSHFAAPEQSEGKPYDMFASDVFNVGKVFQTELEEAMQVRKLFSLIRFVDCGWIWRRKARQQWMLQPSHLPIWIFSKIWLGLNLPSVQVLLRHLQSWPQLLQTCLLKLITITLLFNCHAIELVLMMYVTAQN